MRSPGGGFYRMQRGWLDNPVLNGAREPFCRRAAWCWMIEEARWRDGTDAIGSKRIHLRRGQFSHSLRYMAKAWRWDEARVRRFLIALSTEKMIDAASDAGQMVITVCNYDQYQANPNAADAGSDAASTQHRRGGDAEKKEGELKKEGKEEEEGSLRSLSARATRSNGELLFGGESGQPKQPRRQPTNQLAKLRTMFPDNWQPDAGDIAFAEARGVSDISEQVRAMRDWHAVNGKLTADPAASWRTWCSKAQEFAARGRQRQHQHQAPARGRGELRSKLGWMFEDAGQSVQRDHDRSGPIIDGDAE